MLHWYTIGLTKANRAEKKLRRMVLKLNKLAKKYKFNYAEVYILDSDGTRTVNIRAKKGKFTIINSYAFIK